ncbi:hypothetical protein VC34_20065 [Pseudomonas fluorescens]|uniref:Imm33-like domain-containing protein n=2 Tax=Pseudomonas fluorescens TaxID=294 RepID=A0A0F4T9U5_PSEFL|nr:hypothetical protein VC34_20065 [Pseudomonas fluorescens]
MMETSMKEKQQAICAKFNAPYFECDLKLKVGISLSVKDGIRPLNGLRVQLEADTCGWYIWAGESFSEAADFFQPLHALHLVEWAPLVIPYLGLPPGWRFLITEQYEDVWEDSQLLEK